MLSNWIKYYNVLLTWSALYTSLVSFEVLLLSKAHWIVSSDQRSIKMSVASLRHNLPRFFDAISSTRFWRLKSSFLTPEPSHSWSVRARGGEQGRLLSAHARESKKLFYFCTFVNALRERAVFGAAEFNNQTFEGESFFSKSSVSHLKHVSAKSNSKWRENCPFHIACSDFTGDKALFVHTCHRQKWWISLQQRWSKGSVNSFLQHSKVLQVLLDAKQKENGYCITGSWSL